MPKLRHYDNTGTARFITFVCYRQQPALINDQAKQLLAENICLTRDKYDFKLLGYVFMPEHVHMVLHPIDGTPIGRVIGEIKSLSAREWFKRKNFPDKDAPRVFWQKRCYDHNCRTREDVIEKINYCHNNPVKRQLAMEPEQWKWSSCNWYLGKRDVPLQIDGLEF